MEDTTPFGPAEATSNDASDEPVHSIIDALPRAITQRNVEIAFGRNKQDQVWTTKVEPFGSILERLLTFERGQKDGKAIMQGGLVTPAGCRRIAKNVTRNHVVMLDFDTGHTMDEVAEKVEALGLFAVLWHTHSHMKPETLIAEEKMLSWLNGRQLDVDSAREYLRDVKRVVASVVDTVTAIEKRHIEGGVHFRISHGPMSRLRALFLLEEPFDFAKRGGSQKAARGGSQKAAIEEWKERHAGFSDSAGLPSDQSCVDPARLMYTPRISPDADVSLFKIRVLQGRMLSIEEMPRRPVKGERKTHSSSAGSSGLKFVTPGLSNFLKEHASDFQAADWMLDYQPDGQRHDYGDHLDFACPHERNHSDPKPDDRAFMVWNASERDGGFQMFCMHEGCKAASGGDRAWYLDQACQNFQIQHADELLKFCPNYEAEQEAKRHKEEQDEATLARLLNELGPESTPEQIDAVLDRIAESKYSETRKASLLRMAAEKVDGKWTDRTEKKWRRFYKDAKDRCEQSRDGGATGGGLAVKNPDGIYAHHHYKDNLAKVKQRFADRNKASPYIFTRPEGGQFRAFDHSGQMRIEEITGNRAAWHDELNEIADFRRITGRNGDQGVAPFPDVITAFIGASNLALPLFDRFSTFPIFGPDGSLRTRPGYDPGTRCYLDPRLVPTLDGEPVPTKPTPSDLERALWWVMEPFLDFAFTDAFGAFDPELQYSEQKDSMGHAVPNWNRGLASRAHVLAMGLQMIMRSVISGPCPSYHVTKPTAGTGGSLLVQTVHRIFAGGPAPDIPLSDAPDELRKVITALLRCGAPLLLFDNIKPGFVDIPIMAQLITSGVWRDRILGKSEVVTIPFSGQIVLVGNQLVFNREMVRRNIPIGLNTNLVNPDRERTRKDYKHPDLHKFIDDNRANIAGAFYVLGMNWFAMECPRPTRTLASFDAQPFSWSHVIGGTLEAAGCAAFLGNLEAYSDSLPEEASDVDAIVQKLWETHGEDLFHNVDVENADTGGAIFKTGLSVRGQQTSTGMLIATKLKGRTFTVSGRPGAKGAEDSSDPQDSAEHRVVFECACERRPVAYRLRRVTG